MQAQIKLQQSKIEELEKEVSILRNQAQDQEKQMSFFRNQLTSINLYMVKQNQPSTIIDRANEGLKVTYRQTS